MSWSTCSNTECLEARHDGLANVCRIASRNISLYHRPEGRWNTYEVRICITDRKMAGGIPVRTVGNNQREPPPSGGSANKKRESTRSILGPLLLYMLWI